MILRTFLVMRVTDGAKIHRRTLQKQNKMSTEAVYEDADPEESLWRCRLVRAVNVECETSWESGPYAFFEGG